MQNFSTKRKLFVVPLEDEPEEEKSLEAFMTLLAESGVSSFFEGWKDKTVRVGHPECDPCLLFAAALLSFTIDGGRLRTISDDCRYDLRFVYIMGGEKPSHATFCNFLNQCVLKNADAIFTRITSCICSHMDINPCGEVYVDGTKMEANANKYKFVWKPTRKMDRLLEKTLALCEENGIQVSNQEKGKKESGYHVKRMAEIVDSIKAEIIKQGENPEDIKGGKGKRLKPIEKAYLRAMAGLEKMLEYDEQNGICGENRNSYYKTDHDATAMCLKEDYYSGLGSNMHAGYNVQASVTKGIVVSYYVSQDRNDYKTLTPFMEKHKLHYGSYPEAVTADSGYGGSVNYAFLKDRGIKNYVKTNTWEGEISGRRPALYHLDDDGAIRCLNGRAAAKIDAPRHPGGKGNEFYVVKNCRSCPYRKYCRKFTKKKTGPRIFEINMEFLMEKKEAFENLLSPHGIELRVNRSIQIEGTFGIMKQDFMYARMRRRGLDKTNMEIMLNFLGMNIRKYLRYVRTGRMPEYWKAPENLKKEEPRKISRTIKKGGMKKPKKQPNEIAKKSKKRK